MKDNRKGIGIADKPPEPSPDELAKRSLVKIKNKFMIMSGKGGVGKSSVSVNIAIALANKGFKVGLMDIDIHGPDIPLMLGLKGMLNVGTDQKIQPIAFLENLCVVSMESLMQDKNEAVIWRGPMKHSVIRQFISDVNWGELDYLIIDSPPGTGDESLTIAQLIRDAQAIVVTTPQEVALADVRKSINFCKTIKMKIFGLIENMSVYTCPHCNKPIDIFGTGGGEKTAAATGIKFLGKIPFDPNMVKCGDTGVIFQGKYSDSPITKAFDVIVNKMIEPNG
ncbi:MAG: Mrp/NBP35 family ATP-binding protein [Pseudomonadota bacterium]